MAGSGAGGSGADAPQAGRRLKIAAACYPIDHFGGFVGVVEKYGAWVAEAAEEGAELLVFPEYGAAELAGPAGAAARDIGAAMRAISAELPGYWDGLGALARRYGVHILAGSGPCLEAGRWVNRAMFLTPSGARCPHDKQIMTPWERDPVRLSPGAPLTLMKTAIGRIGVLICYDAEFPLLARGLVEAGAEILLVPSWTELEHGYSRVRIGARARALEGQCIVVQAPTQGAAPWCAFADENAGRAGIFGPPDVGFPADGVIAEGAMNRAGWVIAEVDLARLTAVRTAGQVQTLRHWAESPGRARPVETVTLG
ncbi:MAG: carbon-nitrogen hydrolase family protein [Maritimibacter sp.]|nr:carbon-nitrogen hydrolase family protein [Maritimibacter sp.]